MAIQTSDDWDIACEVDIAGLFAHDGRLHFCGGSRDSFPINPRKKSDEARIRFSDGVAKLSTLAAPRRTLTFVVSAAQKSAALMLNSHEVHRRQANVEWRRADRNAKEYLQKFRSEARVHRVNGIQQKVYDLLMAANAGKSVEIDEEDVCMCIDAGCVIPALHRNSSLIHEQYLIWLRRQPCRVRHY